MNTRHSFPSLRRPGAPRAAATSALAALAALCAAPAGAANYWWTGAASSEWNKTDANWAVGSATGAAAAWTDGNVAVFPERASAAEVAVPGSVSCAGITVMGGDWTLSGAGTLAIAPTADVGVQGATATAPSLTFADGLSVVFGGTKRPRIDIADLRVRGASVNAENCTDGLVLVGYQKRGRTVISLSDGGSFTARQIGLGATTAADAADNYRIDVLSGGVLKYASLHGNNKSYGGTILADGGAILFNGADNGSYLPAGSQDDWSAATHVKIGENGLLWQNPSFRAWQKIESAVPDGIDGGVVVERTGNVYLRGGADTSSPKHAFTGGVTVKQAATVILNDDGNLGAVPETARTNVVFDAATWFALLAEGAVDIAPTRTVSLHPGANLRLLANGTAGGRKLAVRGAIVGADPAANPNGAVHTQHGTFKGTVSLEPAAGVESEFGRLLVKDTGLVHGGEGATTLTYGTDKVEGGAAALVVSNATLAVEGGTLRVAPPEGRPNLYTANYGTVAVSGGTLDLSRQKEYLNAFRVPGTTVVERAGTMLVNAFRLGEQGQSPETAVLRLGAGGTLVVNNFTMTARSGALASGGRIDWDGGVAAPVAENLVDWLGVAGNNAARASWLEKVEVRALEGGACVSNDVQLRIRQPIVSGAEADGGFVKWGSAMLAFVGDASEDSPMNTFNGPVVVRQGTLTLGSAWNFPKTARLYVAEGAVFNANNTPQDFAVVGGSGTIRNPSLMRVAEAIEPGFGGEVGTLAVDRSSQNSPDFASLDGAALRIDVSDDGAAVDRLHLLGALDLSRLSLEVDGASRLDPAAGPGSYVIAEADGGVTGEFRSSNLPPTWLWRVRGNRVELRPSRPFVLVVR